MSRRTKGLLRRQVNSSGFSHRVPRNLFPKKGIAIHNVISVERWVGCANICSSSTTDRFDIASCTSSPVSPLRAQVPVVFNVIAVTLRPETVEASFGLKQCMAALKDLEVCSVIAVPLLYRYSITRSSPGPVPPELGSY